MNKKELRKYYKDKRKELSTSDIELFSNNIFKQVIQQFELSNKTIHVFISIKKFNEPNTSQLLNYLFTTNCKVVTSITHFTPLSLSHCLIDKNTVYELDKFGIPTPVNCVPVKENVIDIVIVPLLAFDKNGSRVGYGKGLYDQFLTKCKNECIKIGVSFFPPVEKIKDATNLDIPLDYCVTPDTVIKFNNS